MDILVNNQTKTLVIIDPKSGCEWTQDLIGNADGFEQLLIDAGDNDYEMMQSNVNNVVEQYEVQQ